MGLARLALRLSGIAGLILTILMLWVPPVAKALVPSDQSRFSPIFPASIIAAPE